VDYTWQRFVTLTWVKTDSNYCGLHLATIRENCCGFQVSEDL